MWKNKAKLEKQLRDWSSFRPTPCSLGKHLFNFLLHNIKCVFGKAALHGAQRRIEIIRNLPELPTQFFIAEITEAEAAGPATGIDRRSPRRLAGNSCPKHRLSSSWILTLPNVWTVHCFPHFGNLLLATRLNSVRSWWWYPVCNTLSRAFISFQAFFFL